MLDAWVDQNVDTWAPSSARDQQSRVRLIKKDQISRVPLARLTAAAPVDADTVELIDEVRRTREP